MSLDIGRRYLATIRSHRLRTLGDKAAVEIVADTEDGPAIPLIWLTEKAAGMARAQLRVCGFDVDARDMWELDDNHELLSGNMIPVDIEEYNGKAQARIPTSDTPTKKAISVVQTALRAAKKDNEKPIETQRATATAEDIPF